MNKPTTTTVRSLICLLLVLGSLSLQAQKSLPWVTEVEYFIDNDPGYGYATTLPSALDSTLDITTLFLVDTLTEGIHILGIRAKDTNDHWGITYTYKFYVDNYSNAPIPELSTFEYFFNIDSGAGNADPVVLPVGLSADTVFTFDLSSLPLGAHFLGIRALDQNGHWGHTYTYEFTKVPFYYIIATAGTGGSINPADTAYVDQGNSQSFTIEPDSGYIVYDVWIDGVNAGSMTSYTFIDVDTNHSIHVNFETIVGLRDKSDADLLIRLYPNPSKEYLWVQFENDAFSTYTLTLLNMMGAPILIDAFSGIGSITKWIPLHHIEPGVYSVILSNNDNIIVQRRFVKL
jgi:hypothetical protein